MSRYNPIEIEPLVDRLPNLITAKIQQMIISQSLIDNSSFTLVAVSGGADSITLLHLLKSLGYRVHVAHINHGLRAESKEEAEFVKQICAIWTIPCTIQEVDVAGMHSRNGGSVQEIARQLRYESLHEIANDVNADQIATGHNRDDQIETVLFHIIRGTGVDGLRGIPHKRNRIVRPLLDICRAEIEAYCLDHKLTFVSDPSNESTKYSRNEIRLGLLPYLETKFNPNVRNAIVRLSTIASEESDYLSYIAQTWLSDNESIETHRLGQEHVALQRRVLHLWLSKKIESDRIGFELVESLRRRLSDKFKIELPGGGLYAISDGIRLRFEESQQALHPCFIRLPISNTGDYVFGDWLVSFNGALPLDVGLEIRCWRYGDKIRLNGGTKKLQDLFTDCKIPRNERHTWPVLVDERDNEILAVANLRVSIKALGVVFTATKQPISG